MTSAYNCICWWDWNNGANRDGTISLLLDDDFCYGPWPSVGDTVLIADSDPTCGSCLAIVERRYNGKYGGEFAAARPLHKTFRHWEDQERPERIEQGPDWLMRCYDAMKNPGDWTEPAP